MDNLFNDCKLLRGIDLSNFKFEKVITMESMFEGCINLKSIIFNKNTLTESLEEMKSMFYNCRRLNSIDTEIFNVNKVINFSHVFEGCENLSILNLSNFQTDNAEDFEKTFYGCKKLNVMMSHISIPQKSLK